MQYIIHKFILYVCHTSRCVHRGRQNYFVNSKYFTVWYYIQIVATAVRSSDLERGKGGGVDVTFLKYFLFLLTMNITDECQRDDSVNELRSAFVPHV